MDEHTQVTAGDFYSTPLKQAMWGARIWVCLKMLCTPLYPMVCLIIIPQKIAISLGRLTQHFQTNPFGGWSNLLSFCWDPFSDYDKKWGRFVRHVSYEDYLPLCAKCSEWFYIWMHHLFCIVWKFFCIGLPSKFDVFDSVEPGCSFPTTHFWLAYHH